ncbi:hypothetical protein JCM11491_001426 [Sporobolomyces phaffii]
MDPHDSRSESSPRDSAPRSPTAAAATADLPADVPAADDPDRERPATPEPEPDREPSSSSSSPTSSPNGAGAGASTTPASPTQAAAAPSRRVKVYKLKDDAWVDLGTGTCRGVLNHSQSPPGDMEEVGKTREKVDPDDEGAWIVVTREAAAPKPPADGEQPPTADDDDDDDKNVILRTRVQPYPPGYSEDFDEEELLEGEDGQTLDVGGYQRQQDTLIVWTERPDSGAEGQGEEMEMALSFATSTGCAEMWEFIKAARRFTAEQALLLSPSPSPSLSSPRSFPMHATFTPSASSSAQLPTPTLGSIPQLETSIRALSRTAISRERLAVQILKSKFIERLIEVHHEAEDLESLGDLHALCRVMQTVLLLNDNSIFEFVLQDDVILGVAGILEYDPDFPSMKASYKSHLSSPKAFISLVPIASATLVSKIHQTHRLHYLKDVILARILEDSTFSMLNSAIYFNEVEIVNEVVTGERELVGKVFDILNGDDDEDAAAGGVKGKGKERELGPKRTEIGPELPPPDDKPLKSEEDEVDERASEGGAGRRRRGERKQHAIQFLAQLSHMAKNLQLPLRTSLYRTLVERGLLAALENALRFANDSRDVGLRGQVIAIWMSVVDLDAKDVRAYCLKQGKDKEAENETAAATGAAASEEDNDAAKLRQTMLGGLIETFKVEPDLGTKTHLAEALRVLLDAAGESGPLEAPPRLRAPEDPEAEKFLQYFYDHYILSLLEPLLALPDRTAADAGPLDLSPASTALLSHLCDLLCFFICHHSFRSKYLILSSPQLAKSIANVLRPRPRLTRHTHLRLAALRFLRSCVARNDDFYNRFLIKHDLVKAVVETAVDERERDNLLGSACLEFFEYVRSTNAKGLINHLMDRCGESIRTLAVKLKTFEGLVSRWEINNEPPPPAPAPAAAAPSSSTMQGSPGATTTTGPGATSEAMQRQTSNPGWPAPAPPSAAARVGRIDVEEESYFNTDDDDDDPDDEGPAPEPEPEPETTTTTSVHFASSRRKREPTSNPALSSSLNGSGDGGGGGAESKRVKLDDEVDDDDDALPPSRTWPQGSTGPGGPRGGGAGGGGGGLVDYMDEDEVEEEAKATTSTTGATAAGTAAAQDEDDGGDGPAGGFIREEAGGAARGTGRLDGGTQAAPLSAPLPLPGALKRKQEEEDEAEGLGGLLRSKTVKTKQDPSPSSRPPPPPASSSSSSSKSPGSTTTKTATAAGAGTGGETKPGGFKIAFGSSLAKAAVARRSPSSATDDSQSRDDGGEEQGKTRADAGGGGGGGGGFGKFGTGATTTTKPSSPEADKG